MDRTPKIGLGIVPLMSLLLAPIAAASPNAGKGGAPGKGGGVPTSNTVGIRVTLSNLDVEMRSADLDLTMYTRGYGPTTTTTGGGNVATAGSPFLGYPAIDYGDGNTLPTATLALTNTGGGPGGSNVYRSLASFTHTYPSLGTFTARAAAVCAACFRSSYVFFPPGSPAPGTFTGTFDNRPTSVIGNLPLQIPYAGTTYVPFLMNSVRYSAVVDPVVTNAVQIVFGSPIPTVSEWGLIALSALLLGAGLVLMRRGT